MSAFGKQVEVKEGSGFKFRTGAVNMNVVAINPNKEELEKIYGREINFDPEYLGETDISDSDGERKVKQIRLDFFLENEDKTVQAKIQYYVAQTHHASQTGKVKVINSFGGDAWLTQDDVNSGTLPGNMQWYKADGVKVAYRGEVDVIDMLKNLLNLPWDPAKCDDPQDAYAKISKAEWDTMITTGDVSLLRGIADSTNNKIGVLLGVKTNATTNKQTQVVFNRKTLRQYSIPGKKFTYLLKELDSAKAGGAFGNVDFGPRDCELREYVKTPTVVTSNSINQADLFNDEPALEVQDWMED